MTDKRREIRILAQHLASYSLRLLAHAHRGLRELDREDDPTVFQIDTEAMSEAAELIYRIASEATYHEAGDHATIEDLMENAFVACLRTSLLKRITRTLPENDTLLQIHEEAMHVLHHINGKLKSLHETISPHTPRLLALERASVEGIDEEEALERDARRWK